ncbi:MAG: hypothetical protein ACRDVP_12305 [Acidimicrobiales bacterium]
MGRRRISNQPIRLAAGAFILNSGLEKLHAEQDRATGLHGMAKGPFPFLETLSANQFVKGLSAVELAVGSALVLPIVPDRLAGLALAPFAGGLMWLYAQTDEFHEPNSLRPKGRGIYYLKDLWLLGIALTLLASGRGRGKKKGAHRS